MKAETAGAWICALVAGLVYLNTLPANFAFDDNFAVVRAHSVTGATGIQATSQAASVLRRKGTETGHTERARSRGVQQRTACWWNVRCGMPAPCFHRNHDLPVALTESSS